MIPVTPPFQIPPAGESIYLVVKVLFVLFATAYFVFSVIAARQITMMTETIETQAGPALRILGLVHAIFALGMIGFFLFVL